MMTTLSTPSSANSRDDHLDAEDTPVPRVRTARLHLIEENDDGVSLLQRGAGEDRTGFALSLPNELVTASSFDRQEECTAAFGQGVRDIFMMSVYLSREAA